MKFEVGDRVVHPVYGVGTVKTLTEQRFAGDKPRQYYEVATEGTTVWVPIDEHGVTVLRGIASRRSLAECRRLLSSAPAPLNKNLQMRQVEIAARLKGGSLATLCELVRDLTAHSRQRPLGTREDVLLRKVSKALCDEWAASDGVTPQVALREIQTLLEEGSASHKPAEPTPTPKRDG